MMTDDDDDLYHTIVTHQWKRVDFHEQGATEPDIFVCKAGCTFPIPCVPTSPDAEATTEASTDPARLCPSTLRVRSDAPNRSDHRQGDGVGGQS